MANDSDSEVLGIVVLARHGDREGFYQDPLTYTASDTTITPLGEKQEFQLGSLFRSLYLNVSSPSFIRGISPSTALFQASQVEVRADAGDEGGVIYDSSVALVQGVWPPTNISNTTLADGTTVTSPLGGYQYIPIESVEPDEDVSLEGFTSCPNFDAHTQAFYNSAVFLQKANDSATFLSELPPFLDGRPVTLENMWNIFDYMNVQSIHNATFAKRLPQSFLPQALDLASFHEYNIFSDATVSGIGNIAFRTMLPSVIEAFQRIANASDPLLLHYSAIAYKPFLSLFNMTGVVADNALPPAIVNYAASVVFEVRQAASSSEPVIRFNFKNGSDDDSFHPVPMSFSGWDGSGGADVPMSTFIDAFQPAAVNTTLDWCTLCGQTQLRGCAALLAGSTIEFVKAHDRISPVGAGFLGAGLTAAVMGAMLGVLFFLGLLTAGLRNGRNVKRARALNSGDSDVHRSGSEVHSMIKETA
ncbi:Prostatic acid phosphatase [Grifola frondosa]|uniref:Prostatic acid phosphatase n=1 Tax=Grifola frondosa TaxID=5627 RepID=A0A1C7M2R6_GRIFR|nr:Prostatic acid phosphatase [Grifola frondosa]